MAELQAEQALQFSKTTPHCSLGILKIHPRNRFSFAERATESALYRCCKGSDLLQASRGLCWAFIMETYAEDQERRFLVSCKPAGIHEIIGKRKDTIHRSGRRNLGSPKDLSYSSSNTSKSPSAMPVSIHCLAQLISRSRRASLSRCQFLKCRTGFTR